MVKNYEPYKDEIIKLYKDHGVDEVVKLMKESGFSASRRWYLAKFSDWNCQKTSNRKRITKRQPKEASVAVASAQSTDSKRIYEPPFLDKCPHCTKCLNAPFQTLEDYAEHKKVHHTADLEVFRWKPPQKGIGFMFATYLRQHSRHLGGFPSSSPASDFPHLFAEREDPYDLLDILDCAEALLYFSPCYDSSICSIKAIVAREATFSEAMDAIRNLASAAYALLGGNLSHFPPLIDWTFDLDMTEHFDLGWSVVLTHLTRIQEHTSLPLPLKERVSTFILQEFIELLELSPYLPPSVDQVFEVCRQFSIPLDVKYISTIQEAAKKCTHSR